MIYAAEDNVMQGGLDVTKLANLPSGIDVTAAATEAFTVVNKVLGRGIRPSTQPVLQRRRLLVRSVVSKKRTMPTFSTVCIAAREKPTGSVQISGTALASAALHGARKE